MKIIINENQLRSVINEGSIRLTYKERQQVEEMLPKIIEVIGGEDLGAGNYKEIGVVRGVLANGNFLKTTVYVGVNIEAETAMGYFQRNKPYDLTDNIVVIQQRSYAKYFKEFSKYDNETKRFIIQLLRKTLVHELIHSKDPNLNQYSRENEKYLPDKEEIYFGSRTEFVTMTGQFFEAILSGVDSSYKLKKTKEQILDALNNILMVYSGKEKIFNQNAKDFIQGNKNRTIFKEIINNIVDFLNKPIFADNPAPVVVNNTAIETYAYYLKMIKKYNPKDYNRFLRELYKTINEAKDKTNQLSKLDNKKITIKGHNLQDLKSELENGYENQFMDTNSVEFDVNNYTISFKPGSTKAKKISLRYEYIDSEDSISLLPSIAKFISNEDFYVIVKEDLTSPVVKWFVFIEV
jgi:hypothetical protein